MQNFHLRFVLCSNGQIYCGDSAKFCGLLRIYELYVIWHDQIFRMHLGPHGKFLIIHDKLWSSSPLNLSSYYESSDASNYIIDLKTIKVCRLYMTQNRGTTHEYQFGCGILKQDFWPRINTLKGFFLNSSMNYGSSKSAKIVPSKSIFDVKNQPIFFKKNIHLMISI